MNPFKPHDRTVSRELQKLIGQQTRDLRLDTVQRPERGLVTKDKDRTMAKASMNDQTPLAELYHGRSLQVASLLADGATHLEIVEATGMTLYEVKSTIAQIAESL